MTAPANCKILRLVNQGVGDDMQMPDRSVRHLQPMLEIECFLVRCGAVDRLLHQGKVVRVHAIEHHFDRDARRWLVSEDAESLFRPEDFPAGHVPAEAAGVAEPLRLGEIGLTALQGALGPSSNPRYRCSFRTIG